MSNKYEMPTINLQTSPEQPIWTTRVKPKDTWSCSALLLTPSKIILIFERKQSTIIHDCITKTNQQKYDKQEYDLYHLVVGVLVDTTVAV